LENYFQSVTSCTTNITFSYHLLFVFVLAFILLFTYLFSFDSSSFCSSKYLDAHTVIYGPKLRDTFYSSNVRKSWHQTISLQIEFAGSWPRPLSLQIALNQINVVTYWWIWVTIAWKKVVTPSSGNYLIGIKNWLPRE